MGEVLLYGKWLGSSYTGLFPPRLLYSARADLPAPRSEEGHGFRALLFCACKIRKSNLCDFSCVVRRAAGAAVCLVLVDVTMAKWLGSFYTGLCPQRRLHAARAALPGPRSCESHGVRALLFMCV